MKQHLSIAAIWALSLIIVSGTTATAAVMITSKQIKNGSILGIDLKNGTVPTAKLKNGSVTYAKLGADVKASITAAFEHPAGGVVNVAAGTASIDTGKSYNYLGAAMSVTGAGGVYTVTVPGLSSLALLTIPVSVSGTDARFATATHTGDTIVFRVFDNTGALVPGFTGGLQFAVLVGE